MSEKPRVGVPLQVFVVDYDLPADHRRKRFYRRVRKYLVQRRLEDTGWSSQSVIFTGDREFAEFIYDTARQVGGTSSLWRASPIKGQVGR